MRVKSFLYLGKHWLKIKKSKIIFQIIHFLRNIGLQGGFKAHITLT